VFSPTERRSGKELVKRGRTVAETVKKEKRGEASSSFEEKHV